jgi:hypothetical protein
VSDVTAEFSVATGFPWSPQRLVCESLMKDVVDQNVLLCSCGCNLLLMTLVGINFFPEIIFIGFHWG